MIVRNSYLYGRTAGLFAAVGISLSVLVHVTYTMLGVGLLLSRTPALFTVVKVVGACYLVWIGYKTFSARAEINATAEAPCTESRASRRRSLRTGFLTNALNPKTMLFVVSTYTQVVDGDTPLAQQVGYGLFMALAHLIWFGLAAGLFSPPPPSAAACSAARRPSTEPLAPSSWLSASPSSSPPPEPLGIGRAAPAVARSGRPQGGGIAGGGVPRVEPCR